MTKQGFGKLASLDQAKDILFRMIGETKTEKVAVPEARGRVPSGDICSPVDVPCFEKSAMDGFAVRAEDTFKASDTKPKKLKIIDSITAGKFSKKELGRGECIEITTGTAVPKGADAVLMVEYAEKEGKLLTIYRGCAPGENLIGVGSDIRKGDVIVKKGRLISPALLGALSAVGLTSVNVRKKPKISYFSTGNEIVLPGDKLPLGKVYDINSTTICQSVLDVGCSLDNKGVISDDLEKIKEVLLDCVDGSDIIMLSGGSSLGGEDFMVQAVSDLGEVLVHGIAVKPGKPVLIGKIQGKPVIGLPGYPTSALSTFHVLVVPVIERLLGTKTMRRSVKKRLSRKILSTIGRFQYLAVKISGDRAIPVMKGSSAITTLAESDGFIEIGENEEVLEKGSDVEVNLL